MRLSTSSPGSTVIWVRAASPSPTLVRVAISTVCGDGSQYMREEGIMWLAGKLARDMIINLFQS